MSFPTTNWSMLAKASVHGDTHARGALEAFYLSYRKPVEVAVLSRGLRGPEVDDLVQGFFLALMEQSTLRRVEQGRGRFRTYLQKALRNYLADQFDQARALKRGGDLERVAWEDAEAECPAEETVEFDREWALSILQRALAALEAKRPAAVYAAIKNFLPGSPHVPTYAAAAAASGLSETALRTEVSRVRQHLRELIQQEVIRTLDAPHELAAEMAWLYQVLSRS